MQRILIFLLVITLPGCATRQYLDQGRYATVVSTKKVAEKDYRPGNGTAIGAGAGLGVGAITGGLIASSACMLAAVGTFGLTTPLIPGCVAAGAAAGGGVGSLIGGGSGYIYDRNKKATGTYQYEILFDQGEKNMVIVQYDNEPIPPKTKVCVFLENQHVKVSKNLNVCRD